MSAVPAALVGVVAVSLFAARRRSFELVCGALFLGGSSAWLVDSHTSLYQFLAVTTGSALLCAIVVHTTGGDRRIASAKMLLAVLTQGSTCTHVLVPATQRWIAALPPDARAGWPTDATLINTAVALLCILLVMRTRAPRAFAHVALVHGLLALATLALRFDFLLRMLAPWLGPTTYTLTTWVAALASAFVRPIYLKTNSQTTAPRNAATPDTRQSPAAVQIEV